MMLETYDDGEVHAYAFFDQHVSDWENDLPEGWE